MKASATNGTAQRFAITPFANPSGEQVFRVKGWTAEGVRIRKNYADRTQAEAERQRLELEYGNQLSSMRVEQTSLTPAELRDAERALAELRANPKTANRSLVEGIRFYCERFVPSEVKKPLAEAVAEFLEAKKTLKPRTLGNLRTRTAIVIRAYGSRNVGEITADDIRALLPGDANPTTLRNKRRAWSSFFSWAKVKKYCPTNPVREVSPKHELPPVEESEPEILPLATVRKLMAEVVKYRDGILTPYVALALFCAVRPEEIQKLSWSKINLGERHIVIDAAVAKMRKRRVIDLEPAAIAWLKPHALAQTPIFPVNWRKMFDGLKARIGFGTESEKQPDLKPWPQDVLRHTGISAHFKLHQNEGKTADWAGNSPGVIHKHYKGLMTQAEAKAFWSIRPDRQRTVKLATAKVA